MKTPSIFRRCACVTLILLVIIVHPAHNAPTELKTFVDELKQLSTIQNNGKECKYPPADVLQSSSRWYNAVNKFCDEPNNSTDDTDTKTICRLLNKSVSDICSLREYNSSHFPHSYDFLVMEVKPFLISSEIFCEMLNSTIGQPTDDAKNFFHLTMKQSPCTKLCRANDETSGTGVNTVSTNGTNTVIQPVCILTLHAHQIMKKYLDKRNTVSEVNREINTTRAVGIVASDQNIMKLNSPGHTDLYFVASSSLPQPAKLSSVSRDQSGLENGTLTRVSEEQADLKTSVQSSTSVRNNAYPVSLAQTSSSKNLVNANNDISTNDVQGIHFSSSLPSSFSAMPSGGTQRKQENPDNKNSDQYMVSKSAVAQHGEAIGIHDPSTPKNESTGKSGQTRVTGDKTETSEREESEHLGSDTTVQLTSQIQSKTPTWNVKPSTPASLSIGPSSTGKVGSPTSSRVNLSSTLPSVKLESSRKALDSSTLNPNPQNNGGSLVSNDVLDRPGNTLKSDSSEDYMTGDVPPPTRNTSDNDGGPVSVNPDNLNNNDIDEIDNADDISKNVNVEGSSNKKGLVKQPNLYEKTFEVDLSNTNRKEMTKVSINGGYRGHDDTEDGGFFNYFITFVAICAVGFLLLHYKKRIIAMVVEGRRPRTPVRRRSSSGSYRKLENNFD